MGSAMINATVDFAVYASSSMDSYWNLSVEEQLLDRAAHAGPVLFLWQSAASVVIGRNQNPWMECNIAWLQARGIQLARRHTGGGTVYQDAGNLNYAFFTPRASYDAERVFSRLQDFLRTIGVNAERFNRTGLAVGGRKVSGNAFCFRRGGAQHHGTLLIHTDLTALHTALAPPVWTVQTRATGSIRAPVGNLSEWRSDITPEMIKLAMADYFAPGYRIQDISVVIDSDAAEKQRAFLATEEWIYGRTPPFDMMWNGRSLRVEQGRVVSGADMDTVKSGNTPWFKPDHLLGN